MTDTTRDTPQDHDAPTDATARYDALAEEFYDETHIMAPGKDMPSAMGGCDADWLRRKLFEQWKLTRKWKAHSVEQAARIAALEENEQTAAESNAVLGVIRAFARAHGWRDEGEQPSIEEFVRVQMGASDSDIIVGVSSVGDGAQLVDDRLYTTRAVRRILDERIAALETVTEAEVEAGAEADYNYYASNSTAWSLQDPEVCDNHRRAAHLILTAALAARTEGR